MRKLSLILALLATLAAVGCQSAETTDPDPAAEQLTMAGVSSDGPDANAADREPGSADGSAAASGASIASAPSTEVASDNAATDPAPAGTEPARGDAPTPGDPAAGGEESAAVAEAAKEMASTEVACLICDPEYGGYVGSLTPEEIDGLLLALNDEYHAYEVYGQVIADFGAVRPFTSIQRSESGHISALIGLFNAYGVTVPPNPWGGQVASFGSVSEACAAGVEAEILNRELYARLYSSTDRQDIIGVFLALQQASDENHLPAFIRCAGR